MTKKHRKICFVETKEQWQVLTDYKHTKSDLLPIAVTPETDYLCDSAGEEYVTVEDFYSWDEMCGLGDHNYEIAENFCDVYDRILHTAVKDIPGGEVVSSRAVFHPLKGFFDSLLLRSFPVQRVFEKLQPETVFCFPQPKYLISGSNLMDKPCLSLTSRIVPIIAKQSECEVKWFASPITARDKLGETAQKIKDRLGTIRSKIFTTPYISFKYATVTGEAGRLLLFKELFEKYQPSISANLPEEPVLVSNISHEGILDNVFSYWRENNLGTISGFGIFSPKEDKLFRLLSSVANSITRRLWETIKSDKALHSFFVFEKNDLFPIAESFLKWMTINDMTYLVSHIPFIQKALHAIRDIKAVILTGGMVLNHFLIGKLADKCKIPMVSLHYGGGSGYNFWPFHERYDLADFDYFICNGHGAVETFLKPSKMARWPSERKRAKPIPIGAVWVDRFKEKNKDILKDPNKAFQKKIMYVTYSIHGDNCYLGYNFPPEIWFRRFQFRLVKFLSDYPHIKILLKSPPKTRYPQIINPLEEWIEKESFENISIMADSRFEEVVDQADAFILDGPGTSFHSMITTEKPILIYAERLAFKFVPKAVELLKKRVLYADKQEEFFSILKEFLNRTDWELPVPVNEEFICSYITHLNDGKSSERLAEFLYNTAVNHKKTLTEKDRMLC